MLNVLVLIGRATKDPELRYTPSGLAVTTIRMAVDRGTKNDKGEREADFVDVVAFGKTAEAAANYIKKGHLFAMKGRLQIRQYTTQEGHKREKAEAIAEIVRFLEPKNGGASGAPASGSKGGAEGASEGVSGDDFGDVPEIGSEINPDDDDVPF